MVPRNRKTYPTLIPTKFTPKSGGSFEGNKRVTVVPSHRQDGANEAIASRYLVP